MTDAPPALAPVRRPRLELLVGVLALLGAFGMDRLTAPPEYLRESGRKPLEVIHYAISPEHIPGVSGQSVLMSNAQGLRGDIFTAQTTNVLLLGGSTAFCQLLDEKDALQARIGESLRSRLSPDVAGAVRVATSSRGGQKVDVSLQHLRRLSADPETRPRVVVGLLGLNNMIDTYIHYPWDEAMRRGEQPPWIEPEGPFAPKNQGATHADYNSPRSDGRWVHPLREQYQQHRKVEERDGRILAFQQQVAAVYLAQLEALRKQAEAIGAPLVLATQPMNYAGPEAEAGEDAPSRTWSLYINPPPGRGFVPAPAVMHGMLADFNELTRQFAERHGLTLVDLAARYTGCRDCFYDQWHFTVRGAERAGQDLAEALAPLVAEAR